MFSAFIHDLWAALELGEPARSPDGSAALSVDAIDILISEAAGGDRLQLKARIGTLPNTPPFIAEDAVRMLLQTSLLLLPRSTACLYLKASKPENEIWIEQKLTYRKESVDKTIDKIDRFIATYKLIHEKLSGEDTTNQTFRPVKHDPDSQDNEFVFRL